MRIAVCDDDPLELEHFEEALQGWDPTRKAEKFLDGASLLEAAKGVPDFDIAFLDIYMPGENGVDIAKALREISPETGIAFVTTSTEHAVDAFSLNALHYLVKPVTTQGVVEAFRRLTELRRKQRETISFAVGTNRITVFLDQIYLLEGDNHVVTISLSDGRRLKVWRPFSELEQKLGGSFLRINRGIIVNMDYIAQMGANTCALQDGAQLPIAVRQSAAIRAAYDDYVFEQLSRRKSFSEDRPWA